MAKDVLRAMERERLERKTAQEQAQALEVEVVVDGYRRRRPRSADELREIEDQRRALRERLYALG
jgi:hypothetical protein